ncbi:MAG: hypothetical protein K2F99_03635 [Muribaculaceae bacterium]|nr:hypothetical protein [Muribaculaceae bacterium]
MTPTKPFIELLKRAVKSKYKTLFMMNRMLMQCYSIAEDGDVGLHYILPFPDTEAYQDPFYDSELQIVPREILTAYTNGHKLADDRRKELKLKPKDLREELCLRSEITGWHSIKFMYFVQDELVTTVEQQVQSIDDTTLTAMNLTNTYEKLIDRLKVGGIALTFDGIAENLQNRIYNCPEIYFYKARVNKKVIRIPFSKSTFIGMNKLDKFTFTIQESELDDIYVYSVILGKGGIEEIFWGYILNY